MIQGRRLRSLARVWFKRLSFYWQLSLWRAVLHRVRQFRFGAIAAEVSFIWLVGLLGASFVVLQGLPPKPDALPPLFLRLGMLLPSLLPGVAMGTKTISPMATLAIVIGAWICWTTGTGKLVQAVSTAYGSALRRQPGWRQIAVTWGLAALLWLSGSLIVGWLGPQTVSPPALQSELLKHSVAEGQVALELDWQVALWQILRWPLAVATLTVALTAVYRFSPQRWTRNWPLWPGVGIVLVLGSGAIWLGLRWLQTLQTSQLEHGVYLELAMTLLLLYWLVWLIPVGAQFNSSVLAQRVLADEVLKLQRVPPPPPSFESFTIKKTHHWSDE